MEKRILSIIVLAVLGPLTISTPKECQNPSELVTLNERIVAEIQSKKPEWKYESVPPIKGSDETLLQQWTRNDQSVRIAIVFHPSVQEAAMAISGLRREGKELDPMFDPGDGEGLSWGRGTVSFRRRNLTVSVSSINTTLTSDPKEVAKYTADERSVNKEFAKLVASLIDN